MAIARSVPRANMGLYGSPSHHHWKQVKARLATITSTITTRGRFSMLLGALLLGCQGSLVLSKSSEGTTDTAGPSISDVAISPLTLSPGDDFVVTWNFTSDEAEPKTTGDLNIYDIDLDQCEEGAGECECSGDSLIPLCPLTTSCVDSDGSFDLSLEASDEKTEVIVGNVYQIRVSLATDPTVYACGLGFEVLESEDYSESSVNMTSDGETAGRESSLEVIAPTDEVIPGQAFTARWAYDNGDGDEIDQDAGIGSAGDFIIDLYTCADGACGNGSCGTFVVSLCESGCYDPGTGDYDVVMPSDVEPGTFTLYVKEISEDGPADCASFAVSRNLTVSTPTPQASDVAASSSYTSVDPTTTAPTKIPSVPTAAPTVSRTMAPSTAVRSVEASGSAWVPPTPIPAKEACNSTASLSFVYEEDEEDGSVVTVAHASGERSEGGCVTLSKVWDWLQTANGVPADLLTPIATDTTATDGATVTGSWLLRASLFITNGVTLEFRGAAASGDCDELKIQSSSSGMHSVIAHGGSIDIYKTLIQSWDEDIEAPHDLGVDDDGSTPRSYISCVSEVININDTCPVGSAQKDMGECRMDLEDSELGYLGYYATESYGISWKVRGYCTDSSNPEVFDNVNVWGNIKNCEIHHMWYGMYSYGHFGGIWINNLVHDNHVYGFDPHDDSDYLTIHNNTVWNNAKHGIIASKRCDHVSIKYNHVNTSGGTGIMLHRSCDDSEIIDNEVYGSADAGIALVETMRTDVSGNTVSSGKWGIRLSLGAADNQIYENFVENNYQHDLYLYEGADEPWVDTNTCTNNTFDSNTINYASDYPLDTQYSNYTTFSNNKFSGVAEDSSFKFESSYYTTLVDNTGTIVNASDHRIDGGSCFTVGSQLGPTCT